MGFSRIFSFSSDFRLASSTRGRRRRREAELLGCRWDGGTEDGWLVEEDTNRGRKEGGLREKEGNEGFYGLGGEGEADSSQERRFFVLVCIFSLKNPGMNTAFFTLLIYSIILQFANVFLSIMLIGVDIGGH